MTIKNNLLFLLIHNNFINIVSNLKIISLIIISIFIIQKLFLLNKKCYNISFYKLKYFNKYKLFMQLYLTLLLFLPR